MCKSEFIQGMLLQSLDVIMMSEPVRAKRPITQEICLIQTISTEIPHYI